MHHHPFKGGRHAYHDRRSRIGRNHGRYAFGGGYANLSVSTYFEVDGKKHKLAKSQKRMLKAIVDAAGKPFSKADLAKAAGCCTKTIARNMLLFKRAGLVETCAHHHENGAQIANSYYATKEARDLMAACEQGCATSQIEDNAPAFQPAEPIRPDP